MTFSAVPGYLASAASLAFWASDPVAAVPKPGGPCCAPGGACCAPGGPPNAAFLVVPSLDDALPTAAAPMSMAATAAAPAAIFVTFLFMVVGLSWGWSGHGCGHGGGAASPADAGDEERDGRHHRDGRQDQEPGRARVGPLAHRV